MANLSSYLAEYLEPAAVGDQTIVVGDIATGADALGIAAGLGVVESGAGNDFSSPDATAFIGDTSTSADIVANLLASLGFTETASGVDAPDLSASMVISEGGNGSENLLPGASVPVGDTVTGIDSPIVLILRLIIEALLGAESLSVQAKASQDETLTGLDIIAKALATLQVNELGGSAEVVVRIVEGADVIASITFTVAQREIMFTVSPQSIAFTASQRSIPFTVTGGEVT